MIQLLEEEEQVHGSWTKVSSGNLVSQGEYFSHLPEHSILLMSPPWWKYLANRSKKGHHVMAMNYLTCFHLPFPRTRMRRWRGGKKAILKDVVLTYHSQKGSKVFFLSTFQSISLSGIRSIQGGLEYLLYVQLWVRCKADEFLQVAQEVKFKDGKALRDKPIAEQL